MRIATADFPANTFQGVTAVYLKSLDIQGFKSFPDKTHIYFDNDITAIVGPNGSGKSNISDAIMWVMGEMSTKSLRGAKMEDVIFGGTQKRAPVGFAEATLTLDNSDRALAYDADEVMVTRRYYRSGDSEYYINRQSARLRDIHEMFMDTGLGCEGYSIIGQGKIDEILSLKGTERREIFEEAAGISKYRHRKEETERKLAHTEENLLRISDIVSELELQVEPLRQQSEKARKYLQLKEQLQGAEVAVWLDRLEKLSEEAKKAEEDYTSASFVLSQAHSELDALYASTEQMSGSLHTQNAVIEDLRVKQSMQDGIRQQIEGRIAILEGTIRNNEENISRNQEDMQGQEDRRSGIAQQLSQSQQRIDEIRSEQAQKDQHLGKLQEQMAAMTADAQGITRRFMELRTEEVRLTGEIAAGTAEYTTLQENLEQGKDRKNQLRDDVASGKEKEEAAHRELMQCRADLQREKDEVTAAGNAINGYQLRRQTRAKRRDDLARQVQEIRSALEATQAKLRVFRAMQRDFEGYQKSVRQVMQEASGGSLRNIHGPISQLIRTEDAYTVAIEIALGGAMQHIVVGSESDGKAAITFLKRTGGGRATFLPMTAITARPLDEKGLAQANGYEGIASELVRCDDRYRAIVDNLLGRTVIVRDIDCAIAMAKRYNNRFKIVTLDGQVMNPGGSMTGGSVNREAGILSRANELQKLTAQEKEQTQKLQEVETQFTEARRAADEVEFELNAAREQLAEGEKRVLTLEGLEKQHEILIQAITDAIAASKQELNVLLSREASDAERGSAVQARLAIYRTELAKTQAAIAGLQDSQTQADQALGKLTDEINRIRAEKAALDAECTMANDHIADLRILQAAAEGDRDRKLADIDSIRAENIRLQNEISGQKEQLTAAQKQSEALRADMENALAEYARIEAGKSHAETEIQEKNKSILTMERACALLENKKDTTAIEERNITDKLWDTYELTPGTAVEKRAQIESVAAGNRLIAELKRKISALGTPNLGAIEEFARVNERYTYLTDQRNDVLVSKKELETIIREITTQMTSVFVGEFAKINEYFGQVFEEIFGGGKGQLLLEDPNEPLTCGIDIRVQPPGKQVKTITLLSGGEKAFVAIALYFAILKVRPTPFCMLDEIDAALDDNNVEKFSAYLHNLSKKTQFIVITHRRGTMEASDVLYGVTMQEQGVSKLLRLNLNQMEQQLKISE